MRFVVLALLLLPGVLAFGISQDYYENSTLGVYQDSSVLHKVVIQNDLAEDLPVLFSVTGPFASVNGSSNVTVVLPPKSTNTVVYINISVPRDAPAGAVVAHSFTAQPVIKSEGTVNIGVRLGDSFNVYVLKKPGRDYHVAEIVAALLVGFVIVALVYGARKLFMGIRLRRDIREELAAYVLHLSEVDDKEFYAELRSGAFAKRVKSLSNDARVHAQLPSVKTRKEALHLVRGIRV